MSALISVHAHALGGESHGFLDLRDAARVLQCESEGRLAGGASRKRRVVAELAAHGRLERFSRPIAILGADVARIRETVRAAHPHEFDYLLRHPDVLEMVVSNMIRLDPSLGGLPAIPPPAPATHRRACQAEDDAAAQAASEPLRRCDWKQEQPYGVWQIGPTITVDVKVSIAAPEASIHPNVDPQSWDDCSQFFDPPPDSTKLLGGYVQPGSDYPRMKMFERFTCRGEGCLSWFENHLDAMAQSMTIPGTTTKGYVPSYSLPSNGHIAGCVGSLDPKCVGGEWVKVESDWGHLEVYTENGRTSVYNHKEVKFDNDVASGVTGALYAYAELARELAELACCKKSFEPRD